MIRKDHFSQHSFVVQLVVLTAIMTGSFFGVPVLNAAIDETMPANIPGEILADWQDQGGTAEEIKDLKHVDGKSRELLA